MTSRLRNWNKLGNWVVLTWCVVVGSTLYQQFWKTHNQPVLRWDVSGYYLYLSGGLIYHDLTDFDFMEDIHERYRPAGIYPKYGVNYLPDSTTVLKYSAGMSLTYLPFFLVAHGFASASPWDEADGYSRPYTQGLALANGVYACLGMIFLLLALRRLFPEGITALTLLCVGFATNYFYYSSSEPGMAHVPLFMLYAAMLWLTLRWHAQPDRKLWFILMAVAAMAALIRPVDMLIFVIIILWRGGKLPTWKAKIQELLSDPYRLVISALIVMGIGSIQIIYWLWATGQPLVYSYTGEGFDFAKPHIIKGLFSYGKGWLVYTPVMWLAMFGLVALAFKKLKFATPLIIFAIIYIYVVMSWNNWAYGGGFGHRAMIQSYPVFAIPLAYFLSLIFRPLGGRKALQMLQLTQISIVALVIAGTITLNLKQGSHYSKGHWQHEMMTKEIYWNTFYDWP